MTTDSQRGHFELEVTVTEKDRAAAREALTFGYRQERVAHAIATARAEALAPVLALADKLDEEACSYGGGITGDETASRIRCAAGDPEWDR